MILSRQPYEKVFKNANYFAVIKLDEQLESVIMRSTKCDLEDWDLDKGAEFSNTGVGSRNSVTALSLIAILEVTVRFTIFLIISFIIGSNSCQN